MNTVVTNSMIMNNEGTYKVRKITKDEFCENVKNAWTDNKLKSYIGYPDTMFFIHRNTGVKLKITTRKLYLKPGDKILVIKKKYLERHEFKKPQGHDTDYEFYSINYKSDEERKDNESSSNRKPDFHRHQAIEGRVRQDRGN